MIDSVLVSYIVYIGYSNSEFYIIGGSKGQVSDLNNMECGILVFVKV